MLTIPWPTVLAQTTANELESLLDVSPGDRFPLLVVAIVFSAAFLVLTIAIVGGIMRSIHIRNQEMQLKRELLDRGLGPEEVARIVEASAGKGSNRDHRNT